MDRSKVEPCAGGSVSDQSKDRIQPEVFIRPLSRARKLLASPQAPSEFPSFPELLARISQLEEQCNAIARSLA